MNYFQPDLLAFTGDQIYERVGEYGIQRKPLAASSLDYLRKWLIFGWEYRELIKDRPTICLPDDHDVYQGNIWGAGGRFSEPPGAVGQDKGGFTMPAEWVKMVHRTQTSHLPDPYDPTPVAQGIPVFYGSMLYGGVSFAIIEDRKWKSAPQTLLPKANIVNGWPQNPAYNAAEQGDVNGAVLLGNRQLDFLEDWALDWGNGAWMKCIISQTLFGNLATLPAGSKSGAVIPSLKVLAPGEYAENDQVVMDHDSNGWPQSGRNNALIAIRRGFAVHLCGDQHLGSTVQYGVDAYRDAGFALCVPSVANIWPRRWFPPTAGVQRRAGAAKYTGNFKDGFGNLLTVHAVSNPHSYGGEPTALMNRAPGYGIVHFRRSTRKITMTNWPRWIDPSQPG
ncbi:MAG: hypothetical protein QGF09_15620, partial [Rhodospirillales bacterium]|nr:hypothetical protein [Rhodospirillales bacterium]